jgi:hypothetical protein
MSILCSFISKGANMIVVEISIAHGRNKQFRSSLGPRNAKMERFIKNPPVMKM